MVGLQTGFSHTHSEDPMIVMQGIDGYFGQVSGFGAADFTKGVNYNCGANICWGIGKANHATLEALQNAINRFAASLGFSPIKVDGFIGSATVSAASAVAKNVLSANPAMLAIAASKEALTAAAPAFTAAALQAATTQALPAVPPPATKPVAKTETQKQEEQQAQRESSSGSGAGAAKSNWVWYVLGAAAILGIGAVGYMTYKRRQNGMEMEPSPGYGYARY